MSLQGQTLDFASLEQALLVADVGSFREAAEQIGVQPSVVSRRIRALEDAIGVSLFQRQTQGAYPTVAGLKLLDRMRRVVEEARSIASAARSLGEGGEGALCVGIVASIAGGGARDLLKTFLKAHPSLELSIVEGSSRDNIGEVRALRMDAVFVVGEPLVSGCKLEPLWSDPIMVALPETHPLAEAALITWPDLQQSRFLVSRMDPGPEIHDYIVRHLATLGHHPIIEPRTVGRDGLIAMVGLGLGVTLLSEAEAAVSYPGVVFRALNYERLPYGIVWSESNDNPMLRRFMSLARRWSRERMDGAGIFEAAGRLQMLDPST